MLRKSLTVLILSIILLTNVYSNNKSPLFAVMGCQNNDEQIAIVDLFNWNVKYISTKDLATEPIRKVVFAHYFKKQKKMVFTVDYFRHGIQLVLLNLVSGEIRLLEKPSNNISVSQYIEERGLLFLYYSNLTVSEIESLDNLEAYKKNTRCATFDVEKEKWSYYQYEKGDELKNKYIFSNGREFLPFVREKYESLKKQNKLSKKITNASFESQVYCNKRDELFNSGVLHKSSTKGKIDYLPILFFGERYHLCRNQGNLILIDSMGGKDGKIPVVVNRAPKDFIKKNKQLLNPTTVTLIYDEKSSSLFKQFTEGKKSFNSKE